MLKGLRPLFRTIWHFKWWRTPPVGVMIVLFVVLILFSDITDDSPVQYVIF